jgi:hypothetical protein
MGLFPVALISYMFSLLLGKYSFEFTSRRKIMQELAAHEKLELHEYLAFKNVCATKAKAMRKTRD